MEVEPQPAHALQAQVPQGRGVQQALYNQLESYPGMQSVLPLGQ